MYIDPFLSFLESNFYIIIKNLNHAQRVFQGSMRYEFKMIFLIEDFLSRMDQESVPHLQN